MTDTRVRPAPEPRSGALLEVTVLHERDVPGAQEGGADRLHLEAHVGADPSEPRSPEPAVVSAVCRAGDLPVFVMLRLGESWTTTGGELTRLVGQAEDYLGSGAAGVSFGFLDTQLGIDAEICEHLAAALPRVPWTFHGAVDAVLDPMAAWRTLVELPGLVAVRTSGSPQGLAVGYDDLVALASVDATIAALVMPGAGLAAEHVPWLVRAGVRQFHVDLQARPGATYRSFVGADHVRSWRLLLDDALERHARR